MTFSFSFETATVAAFPGAVSKPPAGLSLAAASCGSDRRQAEKPKVHALEKSNTDESRLSACRRTAAALRTPGMKGRPGRVKIRTEKVSGLESETTKQMRHAIAQQLARRGMRG